MDTFDNSEYEYIPKIPEEPESEPSPQPYESAYHGTGLVNQHRGAAAHRRQVAAAEDTAPDGDMRRGLRLRARV